MGSLLYFFPEIKERIPSGSIENLPDYVTHGVSIRDVLFDATWGAGYIEKDGPGGMDGAVISIVPSPQGVKEGGKESRCGYWPTSQKWWAVKQGKERVIYWIGCEGTPKPADLMRRRLIVGNIVKFNDESYVIPITAPESIATVPKSFTFVDGEFKEAISERYISICQESEFWFGIMGQEDAYERGKQKFGENYNPFFEQFMYAARLLGLNYRIGPQELASGLLGAFTNDVATDIQSASLAVPQLLAQQEAQEKNLTPSLT